MKKSFLSSELIPTKHFSAGFINSADKIWKEDSSTDNIKPLKTKEGCLYMPWGSDNQMPYNVLDQIEEDETLNTCQQHNIKNCYAAGLEYVVGEKTNSKISESVQKFLLHNDMTSYYLGVCTDIKFWQFAVTVITLDRGGKKITNIVRKEAMYCRFSPYSEARRYVFYASWRGNSMPKQVFKYPLLDEEDPFGDLENRLGLSMESDKTKVTKDRTFAIVTRIPTPDSTYYPIPYYASLFKGKWYDIKKLIALGKLSKLQNAAPLKYLIEIEHDFWEREFEAAGITSEDKQKEYVQTKKKEIIDFLTGVENSGRAIFSGFYIDPSTGKEVPDIKITNLEKAKEGGDWESDHAEAMIMECFVMGVHSNLVGSVPGKTQTNNSGSDKRELYMIAQLLNKPTHDLLLRVHNLIIAFNDWKGVTAECKIMQLTTLDEHKDVKQTEDNGQEKEDK